MFFKQAIVTTVTILGVTPAKTTAKVVKTTTYKAAP